uniref:COP9 signalosome complex subunit 5 n=1 Tax=Daphnia pulex TaxID=6669 RepID=A0A4Y7MQG1_DAPPU|nr:EOG090X078Z [Daphnia pulex]
MLNQNFQEPFVAIVVDPVRTISAGKGYKPPNEEPSEYQTIPLNKVEDFGVHCKQYYALEVSYFKSALDRRLLDSLWNKYWVSTLSSSSLTTNADYTTGQVSDLSEKLEQAENSLGRAALVGSGVGVSGSSIEDRRSEDRLAKAARDATKTSIEALHGLLAQVIKDRLFNQLIDTMLAVSRKLAGVVSKNEKVSSALKRADEVKKYADPLYAESDGFMPEAVKLQLLLSKEEDMKEALNHFQKMNLLKPVLDSQAIQNVPQLESQLYKISLQQESQEKKVSNLSDDTYALIKNYSNFVNDVSQKLAEVEKSTSKTEK